jgi:hypothetical protein
MKSLVPLYECLLIDASRWCHASTLRDVRTIAKRVEDEGLSFITITLPSFCKAFETCLAKGFVEPTDFLGFKKTASLPSFLKGLTALVFDPTSGRLLDTPDKHAIFHVRQVCLYAKKVLLPCAEKRTKAAFRKYVECEAEVRIANRLLSDADLLSFSRVADLLFEECLSKSDIRVGLGLHVPKHGPGSTADKVVGNRKFDLPTWTRRLERNLFPSSGFRIPSFGFLDSVSCSILQESSDEMPVKVITVPKTLKTPRIIAMEPLHNQYAQQSILEVLVKDLEDDELVGKMIRFTDQIPNQQLARKGSMSGKFATLDLSEASDRVSLRLVSRLLRPYHPLLRAVTGCRSQQANVPGHGVIHLAKFASMGSALCFPFEAMVFLTIVFLGIERGLNRPLTRSEIQLLRTGVRVYGDDIIVPTRYASSVVATLELFGLKVNTAKSFWTGKFRESCGSEYYDGFDVKTIKLTHVLPDSGQHAEEFIAAVSHRNQLYKAGLWETARYLDNFLGKISPFPVVSEDSPALGRVSFLKQVSEERWDSKLQRWLVKARVVTSRLPISVASDRGALLKFFLKRGDQPVYLKDHLERAGRPRSKDALPSSTDS